MTKRPLPEEAERPVAPYSPFHTISDIEADKFAEGKDAVARRHALYGLRREAIKRGLRPTVCRGNYQTLKLNLERLEQIDAVAARQAAQVQAGNLAQAQLQAQQQSQQARNADAAQLVRLQNEVTQLKDEKAAWEVEKAALVANNKDLKRERSASNTQNEANIAHFKEQYGELADENVDLIAKNKKMSKKLTEVTKENEEMDDELGEVKGKLTDYEARARLNEDNTWERIATNLEAEKVDREDRIADLKAGLADSEDRYRQWLQYGKQMKALYRQIRSKLIEYDPSYVDANCPPIGGDISEARPVDDQQDVSHERPAEERQEVDNNTQGRPDEHAQDSEHDLQDYEYYEHQGEQHDVSSVHEASWRLQDVLGLTGAAAAAVAATAPMIEGAPTAPMGQQRAQDVAEEDLPDYEDDEEQPVVDDVSESESESESMDESSQGESESDEEEKPTNRPTSRLGPTGKRLVF